jgi:enoyl-CoA hydratase/carnithine racemase
MAQPQSFEFQVENRIAHVVLNRPEAFNALTFDVYRELTQLFSDLQKDDAVRVVLIRAKGKAFCSGGDVKEIIGPLLGKPESELLQFTKMTCDLVWNMRALEKPVIACLNGVVAGAGAMIAIASDFRIAADVARIAFLFVRVGLSGADMGACYLLPKIVGLTKATELLMTGNFMEAEEALRIGLYNRVVPLSQLNEVALEVASSLASGPTNGIAVTKRQLNAESLSGLREALNMEAAVQAKCMMHADFQEGYKAFLEKRTPRF